MTNYTVTKTLIRHEDFSVSQAPETRFNEHFESWVYTGLEPVVSASLVSDISLGTAYVNGKRVRKDAATSKTYTASKDTYVDLNDDGTFTYIPVANGAGEPAVTAGALRIAKVVTSGAAVTSVTLQAARIITSEWILTANTILSGAIKIVKGGLITKASTYTLTINGPFEAGLYQVFSGFDAGNVTFGADSVKEVYPEWWGGKNTTSILAATSSIIRGVIKLIGTYQLSGEITVDTKTNISFEGIGRYGTLICVNGNYNAFSFTGVCSKIKLKDLWIGSFSARTSGYGISIVGTSGIHSDDFTLEDVTVQNTYRGILLDYIDDVRIARLRINQSIAGAMATPLIIRRSISVNINRLIITALTGTFSESALIIDSDADTILISNAEIARSNTSNVTIRHSLGAGTHPRLVRLTNILSESATQAGFSISDCRDLRIIQSHAVSNGATGFSITGGDGITIIGSVAGCNQTHGFYIEGGTSIKLIGNSAVTNSLAADNTSSGIYINHDGVLVEGNTAGEFIWSSANDQKYGIAIAVGKINNTAIGNDVRNNQTAGIYCDSFVNNKVKDNLGFVSEKGGVSTAIATGGTIAHGLGETPNIVHVGAAESGPTDIYYSVNATNIIVNFGGGGSKTFHWEARLSP